jgi:vacuolar-type H+-ATPase subunit H
MHKQTKHNKRIKRKNKTLKHYGGATNQIVNNGTSSVIANSPVNTPDKESIFKVVGDKLAEKAEPAFKYVKEKGLRLLGLQPIKNEESIQPETTSNIDNKMNELGNATSEFVSNAKEIGADAVKVADAGTAAVIANINDVLKNPEVGKSVIETAKETAAIGEKILENFNDNLSTPKMKEEAKQALDNAADYAEIFVKAMDEPIDGAIDELNKAGTKVASAAASGGIKVFTDALGAVPGVGAIIDIGKMANDTGKALSEISEAASEAAGTVSKVTKEISENVDQGLDTLDEQKKEAAKIANRTTQSINQFQNPLNTAQNSLNNLKPKSVLSGGKTRRKQFKRNVKSKRVRFAI